MAKKLEYASDSDVEKFITKKQTRDENTEKNLRVQFTIYPRQEDIEQVKILAKLKDVNINTMFMNLIREALSNQDYKEMIEAYKKLFQMINFS